MTKISELGRILGENTKSRDLFVTVNLDQGEDGTKNITRAELVKAIQQETFDSLTVTGGSINGVPIGSTSASTIVGTTITASTGFVGNLSGNASTASQWETPRTITLTGDASGNVSIDGSEDVVLNVVINPDGIELGVDTTGNYVAEISGTPDQIVVVGSGVETANIVVSLADNVTIADSLTVTGNFIVNGNTTIINGDLTVNGTTTTINSTTLTVEDKNIIIAQGAADPAAADGAGITVDGAGASIIYESDDDSWNFNKDVNFGNISSSSVATLNSVSISNGTATDFSISNSEISDAFLINPNFDESGLGTFSSPISDQDFFLLKDIASNTVVSFSYADLTNEFANTYRKANKIYVAEDGFDANTANGSYFKPFNSLEDAFAEAAVQAQTAPVSISVLPGTYYTDGNLSLPDNCSIVGTNGQYSTTIVMNDGSENNNCILVGSGCYVQGLAFNNLAVDNFDDPTGGFAVAFRPGALILRSPYIKDVSQISNYRRQSIAAPLNPRNSLGGIEDLGGNDHPNPLVGRGGGVLLADRAILNQNSIFPYMLAFGATPRSPNGIGYVAKNGAGINGIGSITIFQRCAFYALNGGQITLNNSGTQFGDISMRASGSTLVVDPYETSVTLVEAEGLANTINSSANTIIDDMWTHLTVTLGYSANTINEEFTRRDAANLITSVAYDLQAGTQTGTRNFTAGFFDYKGDHVFSVFEPTSTGLTYKGSVPNTSLLPSSNNEDGDSYIVYYGNTSPTNIYDGDVYYWSANTSSWIDDGPNDITLLNAFIDSFDFISSEIKDLTADIDEEAMVGGLFDDVLKATLLNPSKLTFGSLIESIGHQFNLAGSGVNKNALPLNFRRVGEPLAASGSVLSENGGRVRWSGADELNNQYFARGLKINGRTGRLEGRPFTSSVRRLARRAANSRTFL